MELQSSKVDETDRSRWPGWLQWMVSVVLLAHFAAVLIAVLAVPSGPWPTAEGMGMQDAPRFALAFTELAAPYLAALKLEHNFHFEENRVTNQLGNGSLAYVEVKLKDAGGHEIRTARLPDPAANGIVRHYQQRLVDALNSDQAVEPPPGERIPAPNQPVATVRIWEAEEGKPSHVGTIAEHLIPRDRPVFGPSSWSLIVARSLARYFGRSEGAATCEIIRHSKPFIPPDVLFDSNASADDFNELVANFGELNGTESTGGR